MKPLISIFVFAAALVLTACSGSRGQWEKADSDDQQLRSALYWCANEENRDSFVKFGTSTQSERGSNTKTSVDENCMRKKGWTKTGN